MQSLQANDTPEAGAQDKAEWKNRKEEGRWWAGQYTAPSLAEGQNLQSLRGHNRHS